MRRSARPTAGHWAERLVAALAPGRGCTAEFPKLIDLACALQAHRAVLDGELVGLGSDGKPDFAAVSRRLVGRGPHAAAEPVATFVVFDPLHLDGRAIRALPYARRRELLPELLADGRGGGCHAGWPRRLTRC